MNVHWREKWMEIPYQGQIVLLQGEVPVQLDQVMLHICFETNDGPVQSEVALLPEEIHH
jgi:hypothetical protein